MIKLSSFTLALCLGGSIFAQDTYQFDFSGNVSDLGGNNAADLSVVILEKTRKWNFDTESFDWEQKEITTTTTNQSGDFSQDIEVICVSCTRYFVAGVYDCNNELVSDEVDTDHATVESGSVDLEICLPTALDPTKSKQFVRVFPTIHSGYYHISGNYDYLEVFSINGQRLSEIRNSQELDLSNLTNGAYLVRFYKDNQTFTQKIVKY